jgi:hypothetical protein
MALSARERMVRAYTMAIYLDGTRCFESHNGSAAVPISYHDDCKICAAGLLTITQIDAAVQTDRATEPEYLDTLVHVGTPEAESWKTK